MNTQLNKKDAEWAVKRRAQGYPTKIIARVLNCTETDVRRAYREYYGKSSLYVGSVRRWNK